MIAIANDNFEELGEPLRWSMHGGPGTGKTHVITILKHELFQNVLGWNIGVEFQIVALQAVMADLLQGDTIHHALAIPCFGRTHTQTTGANKDLTTAKAILQWRWLIIDEISMVSAKLLAAVDMKMRHYARGVDPFARDRTNTTRPFAGVNVLFSGDFWQLPPPDGGFLGDIPCDFIEAGRKFVPAPSIAHGQSLVWSGPVTGIQSVTELDRCERTQDAWLRSVQG